MDCVICDSRSTCHLSTYRPSISTRHRVFDVAVENRLCESCGAVFNTGGARDDADALDTFLEEPTDPFEGSRDESSAILDFIEGAVPLARSGRVLEIDGAMGYLEEMRRRRPGWSLHGVGPRSENPALLRSSSAVVEIHEGLFETSPFRRRRFDLVGIFGTLARAPDPVGFLRQVRACVIPGGSVFVGVPNFEVTPDDLLVFDHLTRLTPASLDVLYGRSGFQLVTRDAPPDRLWLWDVVRPLESDEVPRLSVVLPDSERVSMARQLCSRSAAFIHRSRLGFAEMLDMLGDFEVAALFGLGALALLELHRCGKRGRNVRYILSDDPRLWGTRRQGREIYAPEAIPALGVRQVFLATNPLAHERLRSRLLTLGLATSDIYS